MATTAPDMQREGVADWIERVQERCHHGVASLAVALVDLDDFAGVNGAHGRDAGDRVLRAWERTLTSSLPAGAETARLGGDEYAVLLPGASAEALLILLEEIRAHFASHPVDG